MPMAPPSNPRTRNHWIPLVYAGGSSTVELDEHGDFTVYIRAAANPFVEGPPVLTHRTRRRATGTCDFPYTLESYGRHHLQRRRVRLLHGSGNRLLADLQNSKTTTHATGSSLKALQRSLNIYDERDLETVPAARAALAGVLAEPAASSAIKHIAIGPRAYRLRMAVAGARDTPQGGPYRIQRAGFDGRRPGLHVCDEFRLTVRMAGRRASRPVRTMKRRIEEGRFIPVGGIMGGIRQHDSFR